MNDSLDQRCVLKGRAEKKKRTEREMERASKKQTDLWLLFQQADSRAYSKREREREKDCWLEAGSNMDCHALY